MQRIAQQLGCSRTTVSLVLKGKGDQYRISRKTQERIRSYASRVGYKPDYFASALNSRQSGFIAAVFPDVFESFMGSLVRGMESVLYDRDYTLMISTSRFDQRREQDLVEKMIYRGAEGLILVPTMPFRREGTYRNRYIRELTGRNFPLVLVDRCIEGVDAPCILQEDYPLAVSAVSRLISQGCRRIVCVSFDLRASSIEQRLLGYRDAMHAQGLTDTYMLLEQQDPEAHDLAELLDNQIETADGFFVTTTGIAEKLSWLLRQLGREMPITRFGSVSPYTARDMTDIPQPHVAMGMKAGETILKLIEGESSPGTIRVSE